MAVVAKVAEDCEGFVHRTDAHSAVVSWNLLEDHPRHEQAWAAWIRGGGGGANGSPTTHQPACKALRMGLGAGVWATEWIRPAAIGYRE